MMRKLLLIAGLMLVGLYSYSQSSYTLVKTIPFSSATLAADKIGRAYIISVNQLFLYDENGKPLNNFSNNNNGMLRSVDCSDPMKPVLFYPDFGRIVTLNNRLAIQSVIELRSLGFVMPTLVCQSQNLGYWIFDLATYQLKKIDPSLNIIYESGNLQQLTGLTLKPTILIEADNLVYLNDPQSGIHVFDAFGAFVKTIPVTGIISIQIDGDQLFYVKENACYSYHLKKLEEKEITLPGHEQLAGVRISRNRLFLLTTASLSIYSF